MVYQQINTGTTPLPLPPKHLVVSTSAGTDFFAKMSRSVSALSISNTARWEARRHKTVGMRSGHCAMSVPKLGYAHPSTLRAVDLVVAWRSVLPIHSSKLSAVKLYEALGPPSRSSWHWIHRLLWVQSRRTNDQHKRPIVEGTTQTLVILLQVLLVQ